MIFKVTISDIPLSAKPQTNKEIGKIKYSCKTVITTTFPLFAQSVVKYTFCPAEMAGTNSKSWIAQQTFVLDFDSGFTPDDFFDRIKGLNMDPPNIVYTSFSDSPAKRKFRVIFVLDDKISDFDEAQYTREGLLALFPEADSSCKNADRIFFPGKEVIYYNETPAFINYFTSLCHSALMTKNKNKGLKWGKKRQSYSVSIGLADISTEAKIRHFDWNKACNEIKILNKFLNGQYHLKYGELFGLATNLQFIEGGLKIMRDRMVEVNEMGGGFDTSDNDGKLYKYKHGSVLKIVKYGYAPMKLENFSPFSEDHEYQNVFDLVNFKRGRVEVLNPSSLISLNDAEHSLDSNFKRVLNEISEKSTQTGRDIFDDCQHDNPFRNDCKIYIFKVSTGIGKTKLLENLSNTLIALPTNNLKEEVSNRMKVAHCVTPAYATFSVCEVNEKLSVLQECGLYNISSNIIKAIAEDKLTLNGKRISVNEVDIKKAQSYLSDNKTCRDTEETVITTHTRAIFDCNFKHQTIVFDEDPLPYLIEIGESKLDYSAFDGTQFRQEISPIENYYRNLLGANYIDENKLFTTGGNKFDEHCAEIRRGDITRLLNAKYVYKDSTDTTKVHYCKVNRLPAAKSIIIMSATAPVELYKKLYGSRVEAIDISNINHAGIIEQYTKRSFSAYQMQKYSNEIYKEVWQIIGSSPVITHLKYQNKFKKNFCKHYFGNCSGGDDLKGCDIAVVGTPHKPVYVYFFYAKICGIELGGSDNNLSNRVIEWNNFRFSFFTFDNPDLREIQLSLIESDLLQAVGRNRTIREVCKTYLFSSLPLSVSQRFIC